jgi:hypothetical protein
MSWLKVDDDFAAHPKLEQIEQRFGVDALARAVLVWVAAGCYSAKYHTDGFVSTDRLGRLTALGSKADRAAKHLVDVGLWEVAEGGFRFHDWTDYQPSSSEIAEAKRLKNERQKRWRRARAKQKAESESSYLSRKPQDVDATQDASHVDASETVSSRVTGDVRRDGLETRAQSPSVDAAPSRPDPTRSLPTEERATRVRAPGGSSLSGLPDPLKEHETVGGFEHVWRRWTAEGRALGLTMPSHPRGRDYQLVEELELLALDAVPNVVARTRFDALEAFERLVGLAMRRYANQHREDAKRAPWKLGFVVSAWPELTKGAIPKEVA